MSRFVKTLWPQRISSQIVMLVLLAIVVTHLANLAIGASMRPHDNGIDTPRVHEILLLSTLTLIAKTEEVTAQDTIARAANKSAPGINLRRFETLAPAIDIEYHSPFIDMLHRTLGPRSIVNIIDMQETDGQRVFEFAFNLPNGSHWMAKLRQITPPMPPPPFFMLGNWLILLVVFLPVALFWAARGLSGQLRTFAKAAEEFSLEGEHAPLPETGPEEIRKAAHAFNRMRERLGRLIDDRTRMLSAVGHDLRTPVTRMRLRAEFINDADTRSAMKRDLERMDTMIDSALTFLRDGTAAGPSANVDLTSLIRTLTDEFADAGADIQFEDSKHITINANAEALTRGLENLVHNALKYGEMVRVRLYTHDSCDVVIDVEDNGPGIPKADRDALLKPFVRGDKARSAPDGGFGLGLSIAFDAAQSHGGTLTLLDSSLGGLCARITLPIGNTERD